MQSVSLISMSMIIKTSLNHNEKITNWKQIEKQRRIYVSAIVYVTCGCD